MSQGFHLQIRAKVNFYDLIKQGITKNVVVFVFLDFEKNDEILDFFEICRCARSLIVGDGK